MSNKKTDTSSGEDVEFVGDLPARSGGGAWASRLMPLLSRPNVWARVWVFDNPEQAYKLQSNFSQRQVLIPEPSHVWDFAARGCEVYAVYRGRKRASDASVRRANRRG